MRLPRIPHRITKSLSSTHTKWVKPESINLFNLSFFFLPSSNAPRYWQPSSPTAMYSHNLCITIRMWVSRRFLFILDGGSSAYRSEPNRPRASLHILNLGFSSTTLPSCLWLSFVRGPKSGESSAPPGFDSLSGAAATDDDVPDARHPKESNSSLPL